MEEIRELLWIGNTVFTRVKHAFLRKNGAGEEYLIGIAHSVSVCKGSGGRPVYFVELDVGGYPRVLVRVHGGALNPDSRLFYEKTDDLYAFESFDIEDADITDLVGDDFIQLYVMVAWFLLHEGVAKLLWSEFCRYFPASAKYDFTGRNQNPENISLNSENVKVKGKPWGNKGTGSPYCPLWRSMVRDQVYRSLKKDK